MTAIRARLKAKTNLKMVNKPKKPGNGKKPKGGFPKKERVVVPIESVSKGDLCPECNQGKL